MVWNKNKKTIFVLVIILIIAGLFFSRKIFRPSFQPSAEETIGVEKTDNAAPGTVRINDKIIKIEIAASLAAQYQGLSDRPSLCADCGMLFIFDNKQEQEFVMRKMNFPLDIIFIADGKIKKIAANLPPEGENPKNIYSSGEAVNWVLEINGGSAEKNNFQIGNQVFLNR